MIHMLHLAYMLFTALMCRILMCLMSILVTNNNTPLALYAAVIS